MAVFDTVFAEHAGFGFSYSTDGVNWVRVEIAWFIMLWIACSTSRRSGFSFSAIVQAEGQDVLMPGGCRTPLGLVENEGGDLTMFFTRRFADCNNQTQEDDCGGFGMASPSMCANMYRASLRLELENELHVARS